MRYPKEKNPEAADEDADIVLEEDPGSVSGLLAKAEAQYHQGAFEHSLKFYYRLVGVLFSIFNLNTTHHHDFK